MLALGHLASADDVAGVLGHFSRERTARRRQAVEAVLAAAREAERTGDKAPSARTRVAPLTAVIEAPDRNAASSQGPKGTQVLQMSALGISGETPSASGANKSIITGPSMTTGPSMRTMQGAAMSARPPELDESPRSSFGKVVAASVVLAVVAVLGVIGVVVVARNSTAPASAADPVAVAPTAVVTPPAPTVAPSREGTPAPGALPPVPALAPEGVILGASDSGPAVAAAPPPPPPPAPPVAATPKAAAGGKKGGPSKGRAPKSGESADEYGF
jgi:hypothetical protein